MKKKEQIKDYWNRINEVENEMGELANKGLPYKQLMQKRQRLRREVRLLEASNIQNQPAYTNFVCTYNGYYGLVSGIQGTNSSINITGGTLQGVLKLGSNETAGTGDCANNYFVSIAEILAASSFTIPISSDGGFIKIEATSADDTNVLEITSSSFASKLGFYDDNLISDPETEFVDVACSSLENISGQSISSDYDVLRGFEDRGNIVAGYFIVDDSLIDVRKTAANTRHPYIATRIPQVTARESAVVAALTPALYDVRWDEVDKRLNKKNGTYYKVGEKELQIVRSQEQIIENEQQITEIESLLNT